MNVRRLVVYIALAAVVLVALVWLYNYLTTGHVIISTNSQYNTITLSQKNIATNGKVLSKQTGRTLSMKLKSGSYIASVEAGSVTESQIIRVKPHATTHYTINPPSASGVEPVATVGAQNIVADSTRLLYVNPSDFSLNQIDSQNTIQPLVTDLQFQTIKWVNPGYGVGQTANGRMFIIDNGKVSAMRSNIPIRQDSLPVYTVSSSRQIYLAVGSAIYSGTESGNFKEIYTKLTPGAVLAAGTNNLAIINSGDAGGQGAAQPDKSGIIVLDAAGKVIKKTSFGGLVASWSPGDKYLAVGGGNGGKIFTATLKPVALIPQASFDKPTWLDEKTLLYAVNDQLWSYDVLAQKSDLIANMPLGSTISEMAISSDKAYVYLVTNNPDNSTSIKRVGLRGQKVPNFIYQLQSIMPLNLDGYSLEFINFRGSPPTISVDAYPGSDSQADLQAAITELQGRGFDIGKLQLRLQPSGS